MIVDRHRAPDLDKKHARCIQDRFVFAAKRTPEREHAVPDTYSSRADPPRADPVGLAATGNYEEVLPQHVRGQAGCCARRPPDQSRLHDRGFGVVAAAGVQCRMEWLAADRSRWAVHFRLAERRWLDSRA